MKLDKLIYRDNKSEKIDDSVLDKAKRAMASDALNAEPKPKKHRKRKTRRNFWIGAASAAVCIAICLSIVLPLTLGETPPKDSFYCYNFDFDRQINESIEKYNLENGTDLFFFTTDREIQKTSFLYRFRNADALIDEHILFLDTYEEIFSYVGRKEYDFEFLKPFLNLPETVTIGERALRYETVFDESVWLYRTRVEWTEGGYHYRILFKLLKRDDWKVWLQTIFDR